MSFNNEWRNYKLSELYSVSSGLSKGSKDFGYGYPFVTFKDVFYNIFLPITLVSLANSTEKERESCSVKRGDLFLTRTSETQEELGMSSVALNDYENATFNGFTKRLRLKPEYKNIVDPLFIGYYMRGPKIRNQIDSLSIMTTRASLNNSMINILEINLPDINEQKKRGIILKTIDEKIEVNNQINKTLENMVQAIFTRWFVDFEFPNEDGEPYKSSGGEMVESELGMIPKGWNVKRADEISRVSIGKTPPRKQSEWFSIEEKDLRWISIKDLGNSGLYIMKSTEYLTRDAVEKFNINVVPDNTVVLSFKLTIGRLSITVGEMVTNEAIAHFNILNKNRISTEYLYSYLKQYNYESLGNTSSIAIAINSKIVKTIPIIIPSNDIMNMFYCAIKDIFSKIKILNIEIFKLTSIRDDLLPKLMSGEIRVPQDSVGKLS